MLMSAPKRTFSIIIPVFNEERTIEKLVESVLSSEIDASLEKEIIMVNDGSSDRSAEVITGLMGKHPEGRLEYVEHASNKGKGAAIHTGIEKATGELIIIQDADLEYDPAQYSNLLEPILAGHADIVYGSRFIGNNPHRVLYFWHSMGNKFLTLMSNAFSDLNLTDMETCFKLFKADILQGLALKEKRFGFEPEVTQKIAKIKGLRIYEVGISYYGRTFKEGKKISWRDGFRAIYCILRYGLFK